MTEENTTTSKFNITHPVVGIVLVVAIIGIVVLSILTYVKTVSDENTINTLQEQLVALQSQLSSARIEIGNLSDKVFDADSRISNLGNKEAADFSLLQDDLSSAADEISTLTSQINSLVFQISGIQAEITSDAGLIASIQTQLSSVNSQLSTVDSQLSSLGVTTASLQNTLTSLSNTVDSLIARVDALSSAARSPVILFVSQSISQAFGTQTLLYTFVPTQSGYISISGISSSATGYIRVTNNTTTLSTDYAFGTGATVTAIVTGGQSYSIRFGNMDAAGTITATLSATYYPSWSPGTNSIILFSSQTITQSFSTQTLLYTFTPTQVGYIYITGTSTSITGYIRVTNNTTSTYIDRAFGTGAIVSVPITPGQNYSIRFGNADASGVITATLSATYYY